MNRDRLREATRGTKSRRGPPTWFDEDSHPCPCEPEERDLTRIRTASGYSDFGYYRVRCETCGHVWDYWIEG